MLINRHRAKTLALVLVGIDSDLTHNCLACVLACRALFNTRDKTEKFAERIIQLFKPLVVHVHGHPIFLYLACPIAGPSLYHRNYFSVLYV